MKFLFYFMGIKSDVFFTVQCTNNVHRTVLYVHFPFYPHLQYMAVGLYDTHSFEWPFLLKFLYTKIVKQFVFLVQSIVIQLMFLNL